MVLVVTLELVDLVAKVWKAFVRRFEAELPVPAPVRDRAPAPPRRAF